jgi:hypothetical protein
MSFAEIAGGGGKMLVDKPPKILLSIFYSPSSIQRRTHTTRKAS